MAVYFESKKNKRRINQDYHLYLEYRVNHEAKIKAMLVADGMGGLACGEVVSELAATKWILKLQQMTISKDFLGKSLNEQIEQLKNFSARVIQEINEEVYQEMSNRGINGGTTLTAAILYWDTLVFSNCGDSPAYLYQQKEQRFQKISREQNAAEKLVSDGKIKKSSPEYWKHKNMLTDYIGKYREAEPYISVLSFEKGDLLLLGSDGAFGRLSEPEMKEIVSQYYEVPEKIIKMILEEAQRRGEEDNQTLLCCIEEQSGKKVETQKGKRGFFRRRQAVR